MKTLTFGTKNTWENCDKINFLVQGVLGKSFENKGLLINLLPSVFAIMDLHRMNVIVKRTVVKMISLLEVLHEALANAIAIS